MATAALDRLREVLESVVSGSGYDLEDVSVSAAGRRSVVRIVVDRDGGIDLDDVASVSRAVSGALDESDALGEQPYVLEVTSPGVDRPLTEPRHWRRNIGRLVRTESLTGRVVSVDDAGVTLDTADGPHQIGFADLGDGHVEVEFR
jgi:ribosome maturation factor RimP